MIKMKLKKLWMNVMKKSINQTKSKFKCLKNNHKYICI